MDKVAEAVHVKSILKVHARGIRREVMEDRVHLVAPVVILTEGVHHGSGGPLYYPAEELAKFPQAWNGIPLPVFHPTDEAGNPVISNSPEVIQAQSVGRLFNVFYDAHAKALKGELWVDEMYICKRCG